MKSLEMLEWQMPSNLINVTTGSTKMMEISSRHAENLGGEKQFDALKLNES